MNVVSQDLEQLNIEFKRQQHLVRQECRTLASTLALMRKWKATTPENAVSLEAKARTLQANREQIEDSEREER